MYPLGENVSESRRSRYEAYSIFNVTAYAWVLPDTFSLQEGILSFYETGRLMGLLSLALSEWNREDAVVRNAVIGFLVIVVHTIMFTCCLVIGWKFAFKI